MKNFCDFLNKVKNQENCIEVATKLTKDVSGLIKLLILAVKEKNINTRLRSRIKRLIQRLQKAINANTFGSLSDLSQEDSVGDSDSY